MRTLITLLLLASCITLNAQENREKRDERIRTFKVGFLTERLELSPEEAQSFWPIYNAFDKDMERLRKSEFEAIHSTRTDFESITEPQAAQILSTVLDVEQKRAQYKTQLAEKLQKVLPTKKVLALFKAEEDFKRRLLKQLRKRKGQRPRD